jgi:hypothetical protein
MLNIILIVFSMDIINDNYDFIANNYPIDNLLILKKVKR